MHSAARTCTARNRRRRREVREARVGQWAIRTADTGEELCGRREAQRVVRRGRQVDQKCAALWITSICRIHKYNMSQLLHTYKNENEEQIDTLRGSMLNKTT